MLLTTQLVIQYNPKWITKIEKGLSKKSLFFENDFQEKTENFLPQSQEKSEKHSVFRSVCYSKNGLNKPKNPFFTGGGEN